MNQIDRMVEQSVAEAAAEVNADTSGDAALLARVDEAWARMRDEYADRIEALRVEAGAAGDSEQVDLCDRALSGDDLALDRCVEAIRSVEVMGD